MEQRESAAQERWQNYGQKLEAKAPELIDKAIDLALAGDKQMLTLCINRLLPPIRAIDHRHHAGESYFSLLDEIRGGGTAPPKLRHKQEEDDNNGVVLEGEVEKEEDKQWAFTPRQRQ